MGKGFNIVARADKGEADVYIYEDVGAGFFGGVTAKDFATELKKVGAVDTINVRINSGGGDVFDGFAIYNQLAQHSAKVISHIDGLAASIASVIAMAGDEIRISDAGYIMIHNASAGVLGGADDMRSMADLLDKVTGSIADVYASRTKGERDKIVSLMSAETWMTGAEAIDAGFADELVNMHVTARADLGKHEFKHIPQALAAPTPIIAARPAVNLERPALATATNAVARMKARFELRGLDQNRA